MGPSKERATGLEPGVGPVGVSAPLLPKQIVLINVLTDLPAMAIAADRLDPEFVQTPPR